MKSVLQRIKKKSIENNKKSSVSRFYAPQPAKAMADKLQHASDGDSKRVLHL